ncbi:hypothetical protein JOQ06_022033 [Pogonophryne albipinna]|uniref:Uncharacterized protein n=1 Tax=Pogonophryne albipinna TaxID=1090488 RepID=A0AAD6AB61_9TELE|nr:hypothetical protein JOQ06_022033 [Pogonophryne albipinna]
MITCSSSSDWSVCLCPVSDVLKELVLLSPHDFLHTLVPFLQHNHCTYHHSNIPMSFGPYLPCRENIKLMGAKNNIRPPRPELNMCLLPSMVESSKGKDEVYDRMLLDYFLSYHQFSHLLCRVAINCEKFTETLVKLSVLIAYEGLPLHLAIFPKLWTELCQSQDLRALVLLLSVSPPQAVDPALGPALVCVQQRSALELEAKENKAKAEEEGATPVKRRRVSSEGGETAPPSLPSTSSSLPSTSSSLPPTSSSSLPSTSSSLPSTSSSLPSTSSSLPPCNEVKPEQQEALTSDTETRDSSSLIDPGTEQDPPSPEPGPPTASSSGNNMDSSHKEEKMEASSSSSSSSFSSSSSSLLQEAGEEPERHNDDEEEGRRCEGQSEEGQEEKEAGSKTSLAPPLPEDNAAAFPSSLGLVGEGPEGCIGPAPSSSSSSSSSSPQAFPGASSPPDMLDMLYRTVEATIAIVTKLSVKGPPTS